MIYSSFVSGKSAWRGGWHKIIVMMYHVKPSSKIRISTVKNAVPGIAG
jgi:hypothetical protein